MSTTSDRAGAAGNRVPGPALLTLAALLTLVTAPARARADLVVEALSTTASAGGTGSFDVVISDTGQTSYQVAGFSVGLAVNANSGVEFTGATVNTTSPYIFSTLQAPPLTFATFPTNEFTASDSYMKAPGYVTITPGETLGLENVTFSVAAGTPSGTIPVTIAGAPVTEVLDNNANPIGFTQVNGTITIGATAVPEPSPFLLGVVAAASGLGVRFVAARRRTRQAS